MTLRYFLFDYLPPNERIEVDGDRKALLHWRTLPDGSEQLVAAWPW